MTESSDLFGHKIGPAQQSLFGTTQDRLQAPSRKFLPEAETVRRRLNALLEVARQARRMPWPESEARMWQMVFPNMANWLPEDEAQQLRLAFAREMRRLESTAN